MTAQQHIENIRNARRADREIKKAKMIAEINRLRASITGGSEMLKRSNNQGDLYR